MEQVIDMQVIQSLRELGGDDDPGLILELFDMFLADAPQRMREISEGLAKNDLVLLERASHTLKSSSANLGAVGLSSLCKQIEEIARTRSVSGIDVLFAQSRAALTQVEAALKALASSNG